MLNGAGWKGTRLKTAFSHTSASRNHFSFPAHINMLIHFHGYIIFPCLDFYKSKKNKEWNKKSKRCFFFSFLSALDAAYSALYDVVCIVSLRILRDEGTYDHVIITISSEFFFLVKNMCSWHMEDAVNAENPAVQVTVIVPFEINFMNLLVCSFWVDYWEQQNN